MKSEKLREREVVGWSAGVDVDVEGEDEDGVEDEEEESVESYGLTVGLHVSKLHGPGVPRYLEQQPRLQQQEQHHPYQHRPPIRHFYALTHTPTHTENTNRLLSTTSRLQRGEDLQEIARKERKKYGDLPQMGWFFCNFCQAQEQTSGDHLVSQESWMDLTPLIKGESSFAIYSLWFPYYNRPGSYSHNSRACVWERDSESVFEIHCNLLKFTSARIECARTMWWLRARMQITISFEIYSYNHA